MQTISPVDLVTFEKWVRKNYPNIVNEWELEAAEYIELDNWLDLTHWDIIEQWLKENK